MSESPSNASGERIAATESRPNVCVTELLDVKSVAAICGCSTRHIYRLSDSGKMPSPVRLGSLVRWRKQSISEWFAQGCPRVRSPKGGASRM